MSSVYISFCFILGFVLWLQNTVPRKAPKAYRWAFWTNEGCIKDQARTCQFNLHYNGLVVFQNYAGVARHFLHGCDGGLRAFQRFLNSTAYARKSYRWSNFCRVWVGYEELEYHQQGKIHIPLFQDKNEHHEIFIKLFPFLNLGHSCYDR